MASMLRSLMAFSFMAVATQAAAPPLTEIQDILYKANGARFDGIAQIEWKGFQSSTGTEIPQNAIAVRVTRGSLRVALVPTTNALSPASYTVRFNSEGRTQFVEYWAVPPTSAILKLRDVRTPAPAVGNLTTPVVIGNIQEIIGLRNELDLRPARGAGWVPGRAAAIGSSGAIEAVIGNSSDCVKVDGTSGPCGTSGGGGGTPVVYVDGETPTGALDGVNATFLLASAPSPANSLRMFRNGLLMQLNGDYTVVGTVMTMTAGRTPVPDDILQAWYQLSGNTPAATESSIPSGIVNGVNAVFTLASVPSPASSLQIYRNGILLKLSVDFSVNAGTITFAGFSVPQTDDDLSATYRR